MFIKDTVLIIGAGSSAEFGLPTGKDIINHISNPYPTRNASAQSTGFRAFGPHFTEFYQHFVGNKSGLQGLIQLGQNGYHQSIDLLAVRNPKLLPSAKLLSAWCIVSKMCQPTSQFTPAYNIGLPANPSYSWREKQVGDHLNWVGAIAEKILSAGTIEEDILQNRLSIISFNYDTVFKDALNHFLRQDEIFTKLSEECTPEIVNIFGSFSEIPEKVTSSDIEEFAKQIQFMEEIEKKTNPSVIRAKELLKGAKKIFLMGFDCHKKNCDLIGLAETSGDIYAVNYDGNQTLQRKLLEDYEIPINHIISGTPGKPMGISRALANDFLNYADWYTNHSPAAMIV